MAWFGRRRDDDEAAPEPQVAERTLPDAGDSLDPNASLRPLVDPLGEAERSRIAAALEGLAADGVEVDDLTSLGAGLDRAYAAWSGAPGEDRPDHAAIVERYAVGIGEYLARTTDLDWQVVTDVFGTDLSLTEGFKGSFVVVPHNLVAGRWMRGETGWIPAVVGHIVRRRTRR
jgi:hypothetical protein